MLMIKTESTGDLKEDIASAINLIDKLDYECGIDIVIGLDFHIDIIPGETLESAWNLYLKRVNYVEEEN